MQQSNSQQKSDDDAQAGIERFSQTVSSLLRTRNIEYSELKPLFAGNHSFDNIWRIFRLSAEYDRVDILKAVIVFCDKLDESLPTNTFAEKIRDILCKTYYRINPLAMYFLQDSSRDVEHKTLLHFAAKEGSDDVIKFLLAKDFCQAQIYTFDYKNRTPLSIAAEYKQEDTVKLLLQANSETGLDSYGINPDPLPLRWAAIGGNVPILKLIHKKNPQCLKHTDKHGLAPVHIAAMYGRLNALKWLVNEGALVPAINNNDYRYDLSAKRGNITPLMLAAKYKHIECVKYLVENHNFDLNEQDINNKRAIDYAIQAKQTEITAYLMNKRADFKHPKTLFSLRESDKNSKDEKIFDQLGMGYSEEDYWYAILCIISSYQHSEYLEQLGSDKRIEHEDRKREFCQMGAWKTLPTSEDIVKNNPSLNDVLAHGYFGVAYYRCKDAGFEIVVAHRGTCFNIGNLIGNLLANKEILGRTYPKILKKAVFPYLRLLFDEMKKKNISPITHITHTGFSLGGFIAGACVVNNNKLDVNVDVDVDVDVDAVTFDAPGIDFLSHDRDINIINYVTVPNLVNTTNEHLGCVRQLCLYDVNIRQEQTNRILRADNVTTFIELWIASYSHNLDKILSGGLKLDKCFYYRKVSMWPYATNTLQYGCSPQLDDKFTVLKGEGIPITLFNVAAILSQLGSRLIGLLLWELTKRGEDGEQVGFVGVHHEIKNNQLTYKKNSQKRDRRTEPLDSTTTHQATKRQKITDTSNNSRCYEDGQMYIGEVLTEDRDCPQGDTQQSNDSTPRSVLTAQCSFHTASTSTSSEQKETRTDADSQWILQ